MAPKRHIAIKQEVDIHEAGDKARDLIDLLDRPNNVEVGLCWYQKFAGLKWGYGLTNHIMVELDTVIVLANLTYV
jgi:hypothetical protein